MPIAEGSRVTLHFALELANGSVVDSNFDGEPATLTVGDGNLPPGFESRLLGMEAGQSGCFEIPPDQAFGEPNDENLHRINRVRFAPDVALVPGLVLTFADANKTEVPGVVRAVDGDIVTVDFNHPLAGRRLRFRVAIVAVDP